MYVYLIRSESEPNQRYIGLTTDLSRRLEEHNAGKSKHTSKYVPWRVVVTIWLDTPEKAKAFETYLKREDEIVVYCTDVSCNKSINLYYLLKSMGFQNVRRYSGGLMEWFLSGYDLVQRVQSNIVYMYPVAGLRKAQ